jgi:hypothetical protein
MHLFTTVQVLALALLWGIKSSQFSLAFPFILMMMVPIRKQLEKFFTPLELRAVCFDEFWNCLKNQYRPFSYRLTEINQTTSRMSQISTNKRH